MGQIIKRCRKDGTATYTAQVRRKKGGKTIFSFAQTFDRKTDARAWMKRKERELQQPDGVAIAMAKKKARTLKDVIEAYIKTQNGSIGKSKLQNLRATCRFDFAQEDAESFVAADFVQFARDLLQGTQPSPIDPETAPLDHFDLKPRLPQTVAGYMTHLGVVIRHAGPLLNVKLPKTEYLEAMETCRHLRIVGKSARRERRPKLEELDKLMRYFVEFSEDNPRAVPMHMLVLAAIFLTYRQAEHTRIRWADVEDQLVNEDPTLIIRDMKHPTKKEGNNVEVHVREEGLAVIRAMPRVSERIFPFHPESVSRRFTRACEMLGIEDLHFHDLHHEGISRLFEMGLEIPQVQRVTGHQHWPTLERYTHIKRKGDNFKDWPWLSLIGL